MYDIKTVIKHTTNIYSADRITIARRGSEQFDLALAAWRNFEAEEAERLPDDGTPKPTKSPDYLEVEPEIFADEECSQRVDLDYQPGVAIRHDVGIDDCIAVLVDNIPLANHPEEFSATSYQFIYSGDAVYVTNKYGATIETVKRRDD